MVYKWESGKNSPSGDNLKALADALAKPTEWFFVSPPTALKHSAQLAPSKAKSVREVRRRLTVARDQLVVSQGQALEQGQTELAKALLGVQREVLAALDELDKLTGDS